MDCFWVPVVIALLGLLAYFYESKNTKRVPLSVATYGSWAIVTGASAGLGEHFVRHFASHGFNVVLVARREELLSNIAKVDSSSFFSSFFFLISVNKRRN
jgi:short-subunit dehydrogenase